MIIKSILRCFELISGLRVNLHKNRLGGIGVEPRITHMVSFILNIVMGLPFIYLGIPLGGNHKRKKFWQCVIEKIRD